MLQHQKHDKWKAWLEAIETDFRNLDRTHMLWSRLHHTFWHDGRQPYWGYWAKYFLDTYSTYAMTYIRRQLRHNRDSISLAGILDEIRTSASDLDYNWWSTFSQFGSQDYWNGTFGSPTLDPTKVDEYLSQFSQFDHLMTIADRRLVHWDKREPGVEANTDDITNVILALHPILDWVTALITGTPRPTEYDFIGLPVEEAFGQAWRTPE